MDWVFFLWKTLEMLLTLSSTVYLGLNALLLLECLLALLPSSRRSDSISPQQLSVAVLMPAHNEEGIIKATLEQLLPEVDTPTQILVIADNCDDATAQVARQIGVSVLERQDASRRGKGYALAFGLKALAESPPDIVVMVDADCYVAPGTVNCIATKAFQSNHPVQAVYLMEQPAEPSLRDRVSALAFTVKNRVRAGGLSRVGVPILLGGTGMAFPWESLQAVELASGHIVEDMKLGIDLAIAGYRPTLALDAEVVGTLPDDRDAANNQRTRWEHGHLQTLKSYVPKLIIEAVKQLRLDLLILGLDLAIPPLALWSILGVLLTLLTGVLALFEVTVLPFQIQLLAVGFLLSSIFLSWLVWGRRILAFTQLIAIPLYILWKIPIYLKALLNPETNWVRTKRNT